MSPQRIKNLRSEINDKKISQLEKGPNPEKLVKYTTTLIRHVNSKTLNIKRDEEVKSGLALTEARHVRKSFTEGVELSIKLARELLKGRTFSWWNIEAYKKRVKKVFQTTSAGQFAVVLGQYALKRVAGRGPIMVAGYPDLFPPDDGSFLDALTNATVTNFGQGFPLQILLATSIIRITGGTQCSPYHPGPLMETAANALISISPIPKDGAKVSWFNSGGEAVSAGILAAEKYTQINHGKGNRRGVVYFKEAYHGNIQVLAGRVTSGINSIFSNIDRYTIELEFPNKSDGVERVLDEIKRLIEKDKVSCVVFESTQGDGGGVSMHPDFFIELMKMSLDNGIPLVCDEVQSGFGRSGRVFDVEYLLKEWRKSSYVQSGQYPKNPPFILAVGKSITNGAVPGSAIIFPKEYAVLQRAQGLSTYSGFPATLATTIATVDLMTPETLAMVAKKRKIFEEAIAPYIGEDRLIQGIGGHGLHLFLKLAPGTNQKLQVELLGTRRVLTGTVARDALRVHAPINAPDIVWQALGKVIGETAKQIEEGDISPEALKILQTGGPSGLAVR